jgi:CheY-like chemotaxis protein
MKGKRGLVLTVDDDPKIVSLIQDILEEVGYRVITSTDGSEVLGLLHKHKPDVVILDLLMPKMDGYSVCYRIKSDPKTRGIPVLVLTGVAYELNKELAREAGADAFLSKPFTSVDLTHTVSMLMKRG